MTVRVEMLGAARVLLDGAVVALRPTIRDHALAYLAYAGGWVTRDRIAFLFWPEVPDTTARHNIRQLLKRIRRLAWTTDLEVDEVNLRWSVPTDLDDLRAVVASERWHDLPDGGDLLPGFERNATVEFEEWLLTERRRVRDEWRAALLAAADSATTAGEPSRGARLLEPLLDDDDGDLALPRYMELAARAGDRGAAISAFDRVATRLRQDLGAEPPPRTVALADRLRAGARTSPQSMHHPLFVGRVAEIAEITEQLAVPACRLLTLLGPGGIGKSALARKLLEESADRYAEGAVLVPLETIADPGAIPSRLASELGLSVDGRLDPTDQLIARLHSQHLLLVLDNAEHLPEGWALISLLLRACVRLQVVVTSRERLRLDDEWVYPVDGLPDGDAVRLFQLRARRVAPGISVDRSDALRVCRAVGGSPLAIELAAPWLRVMSCRDITEEIRHDLGFLGGGNRDAMSRHRSINAAIGHSWTLLAPDERDAIESLSVFSVACTRTLAEEVGGMSAAVLRGLVDKSIVHRRLDGRYASHPLVRQYAAARLAADDGRRRAVRTRHANAVLSLLDSPDRALQHAELLDDAIEAWRWSVDTGEMELVRSSVDGLTAILDWGGRHRDGLGLLAQAAARFGDSDATSRATWAAIRQDQSALLQRLGRYQEAVEAAQDAVDTATEVQARRVLVLAYLSLGFARKWIDGTEAQHAEIQKALPIAESLGDALLVARVLNGLGCSASTLEACRAHLLHGLARIHGMDATALQIALSGNLGLVSWGLGNIDAGFRYLEESLALARSEHVTPWIIENLNDLAFLHAEAGDLERARLTGDEVEALIGGMEETDQTIKVRLVAGEIARLAGDQHGARARMREALELAHAIGNLSFVLRALRLHGQLLIDQGMEDQGLGVLALVVSWTDRTGDFTSSILDQRIWKAHTTGVAPAQVQQAVAWARGQDPNDLIASVLSTNP